MIDKAIALHRAVPPDKLMAHGLKLPVTSSFYTFPYIWMHQPLRVDRILRRVSASTERYEGKTNSKGQLHGWGRYAHSLEADSVDLSMPICVLLRSHPLRSPGMLFASHHIASHHLPLFSLATEFKPQQNLKISVTARQNMDVPCFSAHERANADWKGWLTNTLPELPLPHLTCSLSSRETRTGSNV